MSGYSLAAVAITRRGSRGGGKGGVGQVGQHRVDRDGDGFRPQGQQVGVEHLARVRRVMTRVVECRPAPARRPDRSRYTTGTRRVRVSRTASRELLH